MKSTESRYAQCMYFSTNALARKTEKMASAVWRKVNLSPSHAYLLMIVLDHPGTQPGLLSSELHLTPSTVTRLLEKLEQKKLVVRQTEGKTTNVFPTQKSRDLKPQLQQCSDEFQQVCTGLLGETECGRLVSNINRVNDKLG